MARANPPGGSTDPRFSLANERTMLAWHRTALALVAGGLAVTQLPAHLGLPGGATALALPLVVIGAVVALGSYLRWRAVEQALARGEAPPPTALPLLLTLTVVAAAVAGVLAALG